LVLEFFNQSVEEVYYWCYTHFRQDMACPYADKIVDVFSASENSAFWGQSAQRLSLQQEKASQYLASIGKMVKDMFQIVREIRIIKERLEPYKAWGKSKTADVTLKGIYIDLVEGGTKNPGSVYGMSQQVGFTILPDLFFNTHVYAREDVDKVIDRTVENLKFNKSIKNVLKRKLFSYLTWVKNTEVELESRMKFTTRYLRQHWNTIKMYMSWVKPYLRNVKRLNMRERHQDHPEMISAFETSMIEIEVLFKKEKTKGVWPVILATFNYRTRPSMSYRQEYQQGPIHVGKTEVTFRVYGWTDAMIEAYKKYRMDEDLELLGLVDESVNAAMEALGSELEEYLLEAEEPWAKEKKAEREKAEAEKNAPRSAKAEFSKSMEPFIGVFSGVREMFGALLPLNLNFSSGVKPPPSKGAMKKAAASAEGAAWAVFKNYKKAHKLITW
ncbi:hypothetical protein CMO92_03350, partial [Candidatus Woesearchaeota archaeon]|nr:hypothetical protein [Candidatus Woesearchaeota archaeon]